MTEEQKRVVDEVREDERRRQRKQIDPDEYREARQSGCRPKKRKQEE